MIPMRGIGRDHQLAAESANAGGIADVPDLSTMHRRLPEALAMIADGQVAARLDKKEVAFDGAGVLGRVIRQAVADGLVEWPQPLRGRRVPVVLTKRGRAALAQHSRK